MGRVPYGEAAQEAVDTARVVPSKPRKMYGKRNEGWTDERMYETKTNYKQDIPNYLVRLLMML